MTGSQWPQRSLRTLKFLESSSQASQDGPEASNREGNGDPERTENGKGRRCQDEGSANGEDRHVSVRPPARVLAILLSFSLIEPATDLDRQREAANRIRARPSVWPSSEARMSRFESVVKCCVQQ